MNMRTYVAKDEENLICLWNSCLAKDQLDRKNFYKRILHDVNFDAQKLIVAEENGRLTGFIYAVTRMVPDEVQGLQTGVGWVVAMGVEAKCCRTGLGGRLLKEAEKKLLAENVKKIDVGPYSSNYFFPGVDEEAYAGGLAFFKKMGYEQSGESCSMDLNLRGYETPQKYKDKKELLEKQGYRFALYSPKDTLPLFNFLNQDFAWWKPEIRGAISSGRGEETLILAHGPDEKIVGFVLRAMDGTPERFGPFATKPSLQGTGLGSVLFHEMMENMVKARVFYTYFLWTGGRNLDIYGTWGMKVYRKYAMVSKTV